MHYYNNENNDNQHTDYESHNCLLGYYIFNFSRLSSGLHYMHYYNNENNDNQHTDYHFHHYLPL